MGSSNCVHANRSLVIKEEMVFLYIKCTAKTVTQTP